MCAINPTHKMRLVLDVYTSEQCDKYVFENRVIEAALKAETELNSTTKLRWHLKMTKMEAD